MEVDINENITIISKLDSFSSHFKTFFCREEGEALLDKVESLSGTSGFIHRKKELVDKLKEAGYDCNISDNLGTLEKLVTKLPDGADADRFLLGALEAESKSFITPSQVIAKLVSELGDPEFVEYSLRLSMLKQFVRYTNYHVLPVLSLLATIKGRESAEYRKDIELAVSDLDESIFDILDQKLSKTEKKKYVLLRMVDDLANGRYKTNGSTKNALYMFAFAYDMKPFGDFSHDYWEQNRDIEKNLFYDYYSNSFLRYVSEDYKMRKSDYEVEPLGDGINYKNYVEAIYIYCLSLNNISRGQKLKLAEHLIEKCEQEVSKNRNKQNVECTSSNTGYTMNSLYTYEYRDLVISQLIRLPEDKVVDFIVSHYEIKADKLFGNRLTIDANTKTAKYYYSDKEIKKHFTQDDIDDEIGLLKILFPENPDFVELMGKLYAVLYTPVIPHDKEVIKRSDLLTAFFYNALADDSLQGRSIYDLYIYMSTTLGHILEDSRFQTINSKNFFDVFVIITLYRHINVI